MKIFYHCVTALSVIQHKFGHLLKVVCDQIVTKPECFNIPVADCRIGSANKCKMVERKVIYLNDPFRQCARIWNIFIIIWQFFEILFRNWQHFVPTLANAHCCKYLNLEHRYNGATLHLTTWVSY